MDQPPSNKEISPRRLALVITELEPGGAERCLVELATRLDRSRFSPVVYSLGPRPGASRLELVTRLTDARIPTHFLGVTRPWEYFAAVRELTRLLRDQRAEIVQSFLFHANIVAARSAKVAGVPRILTGIRVAEPRWWRTALERAATVSADRFVCVSQSVAEFSRRRGFASEKLVVIPNGVNLARWRDAKAVDVRSLGVSPGRRLLLYVGRLDAQKGLDRFFRELPVVFRDLPEHDLLLVGEGPLRDSLQRSAEWLGISDRVRFAGWQANVPGIVAASEMLVLPSRYEGMPNVVLEAMAAGKPVIATQAEGTVELLGLAALDQSAPVGDWDGLRSRLIAMAKDATLATAIGNQNRGRAQQFSLDFVFTRYQRLYESLG